MAGNALRPVISISASADSARSVALWAFLRGAVTLEAAQLLGERKPANGLEFGLEAWLMAVHTRREPIEALRIKPTKRTANKKVSAREKLVRSGK